MKKGYGEKKGESVFYATVNKKKLQKKMEKKRNLGHQLKAIKSMMK